MQTRELMAELEKLVDLHGIARVIENLGEICMEKAEHVRANWGDRQLAYSWEALAKLLRPAENHAWVSF